MPIWDPPINVILYYLKWCNIEWLVMFSTNLGVIVIASVTEMLQYLKWPTLQIHCKYLRLTLIFNIINNLKWPTLQIHCKYLRLTVLFKIINKFVMIPNQYFPTPAQLSSTRSNHPRKLFHYQSSNDTYKFSFFPRTIPDWNGLLINNIQEQSLIDFKLYLSELVFH